MPQDDYNRELSAEMRALEAQLLSLPPLADGPHAADVLFEAGRRAALRQRPPRAGWVMAASAALVSSCLSMAATALLMTAWSPAPTVVERIVYLPPSAEKPAADLQTSAASARSVDDRYFGQDRDHTVARQRYDLLRAVNAPASEDRSTFELPPGGDNAIDSAPAPAYRQQLRELLNRQAARISARPKRTGIGS